MHQYGALLGFPSVTGVFVHRLSTGFGITCG